MSQVTIKHPSLTGGMSNQPDPIMLPSQAKVMKNARSDVRDGARKRPGTTVKAVVDIANDANTDILMHPIVRDQEERYAVIYGRSGDDTFLEVYDDEGRQCSLVKDADAWGYLQLNNPLSDQLRLSTSQDYTFICNTTVIPGLLDADSYEVSSTHKTYDRMRLSTPTLGTYHRCQEGSALFPAGFYKYKTGDGRFAEFKTQQVGNTWDEVTDNWVDEKKNPMGFKITFKDNTSSIGNHHTYNVEFDFAANKPLDMYELAQSITDAMQDVGAHDALCSWKPRKGTTGSFKITSPYRGQYAAITDLGPNDDATVYDLTRAGAPFDFAAGTTTQGTGTPTDDTLPVDDRWVAFPPPGDRFNQPDPEKMPVRLVRTIAGTPSTPATFRLRLIDWNPRYSGNNTTNPPATLFGTAENEYTDGRAIRDITVFQNRLVLAADVNVVFSSAGDLFNYFLNDAENIVDSDLIDIALTSDQVTIADYLLVHRDRLMIFTKAGRQFEVIADEPLTPTSTAVNPGTSIVTKGVRPRMMGSSVFCPAVFSGRTALMEIATNRNQIATGADNVSSHVDELMPLNVRETAVFPQSGLLMAIQAAKGSRDVFVYGHYYEGEQRLQSAWCQYVFDRDWTVMGICDLGDEAFILAAFEGQISKAMLMTMPTIKADFDQTLGIDWHVHLDQKVYDTGTYSVGYTSYTVPDELVRPSCVVLAGGTVLPVHDQTDNIVRVKGKYGGVVACLGQAIDMQITLPQPYPRDRDGVAITNGWTQLERATVTYQDAMSFTVRWKPDGFPAQTTKHESGSPVSGELYCPIQGRTDGGDLRIQDSTPYPCTITGIQMVAHLEEGI